jgi:protein tyrosine/serine phosphatase
MDMDKFYRVDQGIYRSARPLLEDLSTLKVSFRFESILNLEDNEKAVEEEVHNIEHHWPFHFIHAPLSGVYLPHRGTLDNILDSILVTPKPLLIHCQHGVDRTGIVVAYYRMKIQGWNLEDAWKEARDKGMSKLLWWWKQTL